MNANTDSTRSHVAARGDGKWLAFLHGVLVTDLDGREVVFETEDDARAFLEEAAARAASVDS